VLVLHKQWGYQRVQPAQGFEVTDAQLALEELAEFGDVEGVHDELTYLIDFHGHYQEMSVYVTCALEHYSRVAYFTVHECLREDVLI
jgi:hypothetical protein